MQSSCLSLTFPCFSAALKSSATSPMKAYRASTAYLLTRGHNADTHTEQVHATHLVFVLLDVRVSPSSSHAEALSECSKRVDVVAARAICRMMRCFQTRENRGYDGEASCSVLFVLPWHRWPFYV